MQTPGQLARDGFVQVRSELSVQNVTRLESRGIALHFGCFPTANRGQSSRNQVFKSQGRPRHVRVPGFTGSVIRLQRSARRTVFLVIIASLLSRTAGNLFNR